jgi:hypothetical protein
VETSAVTDDGMGDAQHDHPTEGIPITTASEVVPSAAPVPLPLHHPSIVSHRSEVPTLDSLQITDSAMDVDAIVPKPPPPPAPIDRFGPSFDSLTLSRDPAERFHQIAERYRRISLVGDRTIDVCWDLSLNSYRTVSEKPVGCRGLKRLPR